MAINKNTVVRKLYGAKVQEEYESSGVAIIPGMVLEFTSTANRVQAQSVQSGDCYPLIALENDLLGGHPDAAYEATAGTKIQCWMPRRGDQGHLILVDGENIAIGDKLECDGTGRVQKYIADVDSGEDSDDADASITQYTAQFFCVALEAKDISDSSGAEDSGTLDYDYRIAVVFV